MSLLLLDRPLPTLEFSVDPPAKPELIGQWYGDNLHINDSLAGAGIT